MEEYVIIGGGIAGISAANRLADLGKTPLLIEAGTYPTHKICGEFFSAESMDQVQSWGIQPKVKISHISFHQGEKDFPLQLHSPGFSMSHICFDPMLLVYGKEKGVRVKTQVQVTDLQPGLPHQLTLSTGEILQAKNLIIATGRLPQLKSAPTKFPYVGMKAHFSGVPLKKSLEMFVFPEGYLGISPIEEGKANIACLAKAESVHEAGSPDHFIQKLIKKDARLQQLLNDAEMLFPEWMACKVPNFGIKKTPEWENCCFVGDAASTIPPICGEGLSIAISSGVMAADYAFQGKQVVFRKNWKKQFASRIRWGIVLHHLMLRPAFGKTLIRSCRLIPPLGRKLYELTRS